MSKGIAVIGIGCRYPDAQNPNEFWENILAQRRAFRRMPDERLPLKDYYSADRNEPDKTYSMYASLIHEFEFDRVRYRIAGSTYRATDVAQWLALQVASEALADAGHPDGTDISRDTTGVILGNTLTGEVTRANTLRLRWPYVQKVLRRTLTKLKIPAEQQAHIIREAEEKYKASFPPINHENLAGGLSNTIPGRICNHFDFHGGGYTVDGACASSLLAITTACSQLEAGDLDVAIAGGVDISLDPFELVGFAKMGALAEQEMLVYDSRSAGFLPGEGCGIVVLKRLDDALRDKNRIYAIVKGWGVSSDGHGGLTTPSSSGQALAVKRAYSRSGYGIETSAFIEGHGTGTTVGDKVELAALASAAGTPAHSGIARLGVGSVKANIGHTKAAAGIAGFIKTALALHEHIIPPMPGCVKPSGVFRDEAAALYPLRTARLPEPGATLRAGVSAFGFGGINTHVALESAAQNEKREFSVRERLLTTSSQDSEVFLFSAKKQDDLKEQLEQVRSFAMHISAAEMTDLAAALAAKPSHKELRAAIVASHPEELSKKLERLYAILINNGSVSHFSHIDLRDGVFVSRGQRPPKIGFLYPGQGTQQLNMTHPLYQRYDLVRASYKLADKMVGPIDGKPLSEYIFRDVDRSISEIENWKLSLTQTQIAQPAIVAASVSMTSVLSHFGITPSVSVGYSLGEWSALWSAGVFSEADLYKCVAARGRAMAAHGDVKGTMATVAASPKAVQKLLDKIKGYVVIAGYNTPKQAVISGEASAVNEAVSLCRREGFAAIPLRVSNAFHSALVSSSTELLRIELSSIPIAEPRNHVISTITGQELRLQSLREDLCTQILEPVRFSDAMSQAEQFGVDVLVEVGPGRSLSAMMDDIELSGLQAILCTDDMEGTSFRAMNSALGCLYVLGAPVNTKEIYAARFTRPFQMDHRPRFISNPCETPDEEDQNFVDAVLDGMPKSAHQPHDPQIEQPIPAEAPGSVPAMDLGHVLEKVLDLASEITEYPREVIQPEQLLLRDLNLNSIASAQLVAEAARRLQLPRPADVMEYSTCSLQDVAQTLFGLLSTQKGGIPAQSEAPVPEGISPWIRTSVVEMREEILSPSPVSHLREFHRCLLISEEHHPFAGEFLERLIARGVDVAHCHANAPEAEFESLFSPEHEYDAVFVVMPAPEPTGSIDAWKISPNEFSSRVQRLSHPLFTFGKQFAKWSSEKKRRDVFLGLVQFGGGMYGRGDHVSPSIDLACGAGFAKSLHLELRLDAACVVDLAPEIPAHVGANTVLREFQEASGFVEAGYTADSTRRVPYLRLEEHKSSRSTLLNKEDVLLVTGGGRGIGAECAVSIARKYGCRVALLGRTDIDAQHGSTSAGAADVRATLSRLDAIGIHCKYVACDISDSAKLGKAMHDIRSSLGEITAVLHAAGNNIPQATKNIDAKSINDVLSPKIHGTINLLNAVSPAALKTFITFGSIIGQTGMQGEASYAFANEWMNLLMLRAADAMPRTRWYSLNWSVWSAVGMGEQLGSVEALAREGITPIDPARGVDELLALLDREVPTPELIISGRLGGSRIRQFAPRALPLLRFLEEERVHYPGVELVCDCILSAENDLYLPDHLFEGMQLFPTVIGIEAMVQLASALAPGQKCPAVENLELLRPIMVHPGGKTKIRILAQVTESSPNAVDVVIRSEETKFEIDHFRGRCIIGSIPKPIEQNISKIAIPESSHPLSPAEDLYGRMLFQGEIFRHLAGYKFLSATSCLAEISPGGRPIFGRYFPQTLLTGDPTMRDVFLHAIQPCVPQQQILPVSIDAVRFLKDPGSSTVYAHAVERGRSESEYVYDVYIYEGGECVEILDRFRCRAIGMRTMSSPGSSIPCLHAGLLAPYLERSIQFMYPHVQCSISADFRPSNVDGGARSDIERNNILHDQRKKTSRAAMQHALRDLLMRTANGEFNGLTFDISYAGNGKPEALLPENFRHLQDSLSLSATHLESLTLGMAGLNNCACDLETVEDRTEPVWTDLLGTEGMSRAREIGSMIDEPAAATRTRVWTMLECLRKSGIGTAIPNSGKISANNGCIILKLQNEGEDFDIMTQRIQLLPGTSEVVAAVLVTASPKSAKSRTAGGSERHDNLSGEK
ncbi:MAG TPA: SDR family NAD(P)-dependent oxidoreductase [Bacteroidota bacterium]|nr:SDR family NAD(P)-dependent oxidoreductase [Bacteroidota bacterium]